MGVRNLLSILLDPLSDRSWFTLLATLVTNTSALSNFEDELFVSCIMEWKQVLVYCKQVCDNAPW